jgi:sulfur carrier protein
MDLKINQEVRQFPDNASLSEILSLLEIKNFNGLAVAINNQVIPKNEWKACRPAGADDVTIIRAVQGG